MKTVIIIMSIILVVCILVICVLGNRVKQFKTLLNDEIRLNNNLHAEIKKLVDMDKIKSDNRKEADEKINELHSGDSVDNAINVLRDYTSD